MATDSSTALITGGTSGIGRAAATKLAQLGVHVTVVGRNAQRGEKTVAESAPIIASPNEMPAVNDRSAAGMRFDCA